MTTERSVHREPPSSDITRRSRDLWHAIEPLHSVIYFSPEGPQAAREIGLRGFWMGYFGFRAAPMGEVGSAVVEATFFNFHASRVQRALPDAWRYASPQVIATTRSRAAAQALRRLLGSKEAEDLALRVGPVLERAVTSGSAAGRPLFAANRELPTPADPVEAFWQATTSLREHRGDGHVALLTAAGLRGCEALVLFSSDEHIDPAVFTESRGWSGPEWSEAERSLCDRGLVADRRLTESGQTLRRDIERGTDELAWQPYARLPDDVLVSSLDRLAHASRAVVAAGEIPFPNPIGLPRPWPGADPAV